MYMNHQSKYNVLKPHGCFINHKLNKQKNLNYLSSGFSGCTFNDVLNLSGEVSCMVHKRYMINTTNNYWIKWSPLL